MCATWPQSQHVVYAMPEGLLPVPDVTGWGSDPPRIIRANLGVAGEGPLICGVCGHGFRAA